METIGIIGIYVLGYIDVEYGFRCVRLRFGVENVRGQLYFYLRIGWPRFISLHRTL